MTSWMAAAALAALAATSASCAAQPADLSTTERLTQLYTPRFGPPPASESASVTLAKVATRWATGLPETVAPWLKPRTWLPNQAAVLWLYLVVMLMAAFDFRNPSNPRNIDLLVLQAIGWCFLDVLSFLDHLGDPTSYAQMDWVFTAVVALTVTLLVRSVRGAGDGALPSWRRWARPGILRALALLLLTLNLGTAWLMPPDDAGYFINIGGQRFRERLRWPYGDPLLTGTPAAAYGPVLYAAHVPFQLALAPQPVNAVSPPSLRIDAGEAYYLPPLLATKLSTMAFHVLGVAALFVAARRLAGLAAAWALVALYCGSPFVLGVGGEDYAIGGMTFASHIAPAALTLLAFAWLDSPLRSGAALAAAVGALFYPVFLVPAWLGYYWADTRRLRRFLLGFGVASVLIGGSVLWRSEPAGGRGLVGTILYDTIGHQESPEAYGSSPFGFWGQRGGVRGWLMTPVVGDQPMTRPVVLAFFAFAIGALPLARGRSPQQLALLVAAVAMGAQLWKVHATATYVTWYYPFLLLGLLGHAEPRADARMHA